MKEFFRSFFASILANFVFFIIGIFLIFMIIGGVKQAMEDDDQKKNKGNVLVIDLSNPIHEQGRKNPLAFLNVSSSYKPGLYDIMKSLDEAAEDDDIKGILLKLTSGTHGWAEFQQLKWAIDKFKTSGKFVYAYGEVISQGSYYAATSADSIFLNPAGDIALKGLSTELMFFKGTLDKLDVQPEIFYAGRFKSATEPFRAEQMSDANRLQVRVLQNTLWQEFLASTARYTHTDTTAVQQLATTGAIQFPTDAERYKVASLRYWDEVEQLMKQKAGLPMDKEIKYVSIFDYAKPARSGSVGSNTRVAVLFAEGEIIDGKQKEEFQIGSKTFTDEIRKIANDDKVKAVVLRVNSPGGSALASDVILRELTLLHAKKPLVVSMGDYAASGGYYIASRADSIFAMPTTLTGSIGVFGMLFNVDKLMKNKLGITFDGVKNAPYADFPSATRPLTADEAARMQRSIDTVYAHFKKHVSEGRKLPAADVDSIAQGRVWTGRDALRIGLVDRLGGLEDAIACAARLAKLKSYKVITYPEPTDRLETLMRGLSANTDAKAAIKEAMKEEMGQGYDWYHQVQELGRLNGRAMTLLPFKIAIQ